MSNDEEQKCEICKVSGINKFKGKTMVSKQLLYVVKDLKSNCLFSCCGMVSCSKCYLEIKNKAKEENKPLFCPSCKTEEARDDKECFDNIMAFAKDGEKGWALEQSGLCYEKGIGVAMYQEEALEYYKDAAEKNLPLSQYMIANAYLEGVDGIDTKIEKDPTKALHYFEASSKQGHPGALNELGNMYFTGIKGFVDKDFDLAMHYFTESAEKGNKKACFRLAVMFANGIENEIEKNYVKAIYWFRMFLKANKKQKEDEDEVDEDEEAKKEVESVKKALNFLLKLTTAYCANCLSVQGDMVRCSRCTSVKYCSVDCQKEHWKRKVKGHKADCKHEP